MKNNRRKFTQLQTNIHPAAVVEPGAQVGAGVVIGPFCHVSADSVIGDGVELVGHVSILGATTIGDGTKVYPMAVLGAPPQNAKHKGGRTTLVIGRNCTIREGVTMHRGTDISRGETTVGDNGNFLAYAHIAHDCVIGRNMTMANLATLGGHCELGDFVNIGGFSAVHQFSRIGDFAFVAGGSMVLGDVIPYAMASGNRAKLRGLNVVGLRRSGMAHSDIRKLRQAYRAIFDRARPLSENLTAARTDFADFPYAMNIVKFLDERGKRQFVVPPLNGALDDDADDES